MLTKPHFRILLLAILILIGSGTLLLRLYNFQIKEQDVFVNQVLQPRSISIREPSVRGEITDRNGEILAQNVRNYEVDLNLEEISKAFHKQNSASRGKKKDIATIVDEWILPVFKEIGIDSTYSKAALRSHYLTHRGLVPYTYPADLTFEQFSRLSEHTVEIPGIDPNVRPRRQYPYGSLACHILGYLKKWEKGNIPDADRKKYNHYLGEDTGLMGTEATMDEFLRGSAGEKIILKDEKNRILTRRLKTPPNQGAQVTLTIDAPIQYLLENILRKTGRSTAIIMDTNTGEILAMASVPDFNPNDFIPTIAKKKYQQYIGNKASPFTNRALSSYMPGSTFKLPTAIAGCLYGRARHKHNCTGSVRYGSRAIRCHNRSGHSYLTMSNAIKQSCNPYFMTLANSIGNGAMVKAFQTLGFGRKTGIRLPNEAAGLVPGSSRWKRSVEPGMSMTLSLNALFAIGQADAQCTPLQLLSLVSAIANGGRQYQPRIIKKVTHPQKGTIIKDTPVLKTNLLNEGVTASQLKLIRKGMWRAVNESGGTAGRVAVPNFQIAAKTGTVQTGYDRDNFKHHAWTVAFAPYNKPRYTVVVYVEGGESGGRVAGTLVHLIFRGLVAAEKGLRLPLAKMEPYKGHFDSIKDIPLPPR